MHGAELLTDLLVVLGCAAAVAIALQRLRMAAIPAYLIAGAIIGPHALGFVHSPEALETIAHLAIILLMFGIGLELHLDSMRGGLGRMALIGAAACLVTTLAGWPVAMAFGFGAPAALAAAMGLSLSSTAVVLRIVASRRETHHPWARLSLAVLVIQDMAVIAMLAALGPLAQWAGADVAGAEHIPPYVTLLKALGRGGAIILFAVGGAWLLPRLLRQAARTATSEVMMILSVALAMGAAAVTSRLGFSMELGAFLAGLMLAGTHFRHQISGQIGPLRDLFLAVFFTVLGMELDPAVLAGMWWALTLGVSAMAALKILTIGATAWSAGVWAPVALTSAFALAQAGEFSIVLFSAAAGRGLFDERQTMGLIAAVVISLIFTPMLMDLGRRLAPRAEALGTWRWALRAIDRQPPPGPEGEDPPPHAIIAGYGPGGRRIARELTARGMAFCVIELNAATVREESALGTWIVYGDASNAAVLESAGIHRAGAVILTFPDATAIQRACTAIRALSVSTFIVARVATIRHARAAEGLGADRIVTDEMATAELMATVVGERCGAEQSEE